MVMRMKLIRRKSKLEEKQCNNNDNNKQYHYIITPF